MRIIFPKAIPLFPLLIFLAAVVLVQIIQGTDPVFALLMLMAQLAAVVAFNRMGGMTHMAGALCLFAILPNVTVPEFTHILLRQPGDYNLQHPLVTAGVCAGYFASLMTAALLVSSMSRPVALIDYIHFSIFELRIISVVSCVFAVSLAIRQLTLGGPVQDGSLLAALNHFEAPMLATSVMLGTYVRIVTTNGRSAMNWYVAFLLVVSVIPGLLNASKEGMLVPLLCWVMVVASSRHRFTWFGTLGLVTVAIGAWVFVYPFSQNARGPVRESDSISDRVSLIIQFLRDPSAFPDSISNSEESSEFGTDSSKVNIIARWSLLKSNDMLIDADFRSGYTSIDRYAPVLLSVVPHAFWPDRPGYILSNELGHKAGFRMAESDFTTGISIGSPGLFFDLGGWVALIVYTLTFFIAFYFVAIRLIGSSETSIWGLVPIGVFANVAGSFSPSLMFLLVVSFMGMFFVMIAILKTISYTARLLISKPIPTKISLPRW
jgi:hypothetical protein